MRRPMLLLAMTFVVLTPEALFGQLGGLRRRAQEAVTPRQEQPKAVQPVPVIITNDVITKYLKGIAAREEYMRTLARENTQAGQYFAAVLKRDSLHRRQNEYRAEQGADWERGQRLREAMGRGDAAAAQELNRLEASLDPGQVTIPEADWNAQRDGNAKMDSIAIIGSGMDAGEWMYLGCLMPRIASMMAHNGAVDDSMVAAIVRSDPKLTREQVLAVRGRRVELARALNLTYRSDAQIARGDEEQQRREQAAQGPDTTTYNGCLTVGMKAVSDSMTKRQPEIDAAAARNDIAKLSEISTQLATLQQKAQEKCAPLLNQ